MANCNTSGGGHTYYVIDDMSGKNAGLFCHYLFIVPFISYALKKGFIPIVDMKHNRNQYFKLGREYRDNVWDYFFKQPCGVTLEMLEENSKIMISDERDVPFFSVYDILKDIKKAKEEFKDWLNIVELNDETNEFLNSEYDRICDGETEVLGILCRGTDYLNTRPLQHAIQPSSEDVIKKAKELLKKYNYKKIWLATEDANIYKTFKDEFKDMLLDNPQYMYAHTGDKLLYEVEVDRDNHFYNLAKEYLLSVYMLSKCKYFIGGYVAGTVGAWYLSNGFENQDYVYIWYNGKYGCKEVTSNKNKLEKIFSIKNGYFEDKKYKVVTILNRKLWIYAGKTKNLIKEYVKN